MSEVIAKDWKLDARAVVKLNRKNSSTFVSAYCHLFYRGMTDYHHNGPQRSCIRPQRTCFGQGSQLNSTQLNEHLWTQVIKHLNVHIYLVTISYRYYNQLISRTDLSPILVRSAAKSYITSWCIQNLSKRVLNRQTVSTSTT